jgi:hypothetical protein
MVLYFSSNATGNLVEKCIQRVAECRLANFDEKNQIPSDSVLVFRAIPKQLRMEEEFADQMRSLATVGLITLWPSPDAERLAINSSAFLPQLINLRSPVNA